VACRQAALDSTEGPTAFSPLSASKEFNPQGVVVSRAGMVGPCHIMKIMVRVSSRQDEHVTDEYLWPESLPLILPGVGDEIVTSRFGLRTVVRRHFTYTNTASDGGVTDLIIDVICE
jgi:hypothetical protein